MERMNRRQWLNLAGAQVGGLYFGSSLLAQQGGDFNERAIEPRIHREDKSDIWTLHFNFKDPRVITVDVPGRGTKVVWYLLYKVINRTNAGQKFYPDFELVTLDKHTVHSDEILPSVEDAIKRREDPTNRLDIKNSVTISKDDIPVTKADSFPGPLRVWRSGPTFTTGPRTPTASAYSSPVYPTAGPWMTTR